ncbi:MBL fold metallo-hydrolase [Glaciecola petra]|uniref:MBL fold metallo-hydrolase n=1 Tax=Glaciecola petra TaxID=3075602 RepID=A0ABU2ZVU8_9ALTE|nr:MBL fold metallo-hydrolase [Aestuariibacter sp. P117]MDT0596424.1 MBL fold metallo-hydrolase [Aestuariibacter sp. P117]
MTFNKVVALIALCILLNSCASNKNIRSLKAHHTENGFQNTYIQDTDKGLLDFFKMRFLGDEEWADHFALGDTVPVQEVDISALDDANKNKHSQITWLGHSTFLVQHNGVSLLTDPIFSDRASPTSFAGPQRYVPHAMDYRLLPKIDWVVISHNHYDHLDASSISLLVELSEAQDSPIQFAVPLGLAEFMLDNDVKSENLHELDWEQSTQNSAVIVQALPSQHWSARGLSDKRNTLWASWVVTINGYKIWFAGDTGYNNVQFKRIGEQLESVDLALIPIGAYAPRWFMQYYHVNPAEAVKIHQEVNSKLSIGMHWGTFPLTAEAPLAPVVELKKQLEKAALDTHTFVTLKVGETRPLKP